MRGLINVYASATFEQPELSWIHRSGFPLE
jgi:hypothetical protein